MVLKGLSRNFLASCEHCQD